MSNTGLPIFDETIQQTNRWLSEILDHISEGDWDRDDQEEHHRRRAYNALRAVLLTLRDRIPVGLSAHLAGQLPLLIRGLYYERYEPENLPKTYREDGAFYEHVAQAMDPQFHFGAEDSAKAVFVVLSAHLPGGTVEKVRNALPADVRNAWADLEIA